MERVQSHRDLIVWQKAMEIAVLIYRLVANLPSHERFGLSQQLTRAAVSVAANIAEGNARGTAKDYAHFLAIARGSLMETETYLLLAVRLEYLGAGAVDPIMSIITEIDRMLVAMRRKLLLPVAGKDELYGKPQMACPHSAEPIVDVRTGY